MRRHTFLPFIAIALFVAYSAIVTATSGTASLAASPILVAAIAMMIWHNGATTESATTA